MRARSLTRCLKKPDLMCMIDVAINIEGGPSQDMQSRCKPFTDF